jgi:uncharacterized protein YndB with AHSA1/START domain
MARTQWHKFYSAQIAAPSELLFRLLSDLPNYSQWLPGSEQYAQTTEVEPYPVQLGSRYVDGKPGETGKNWPGSVTGFQPPGALDFHHTIYARQVRATIDTHIHYSIEPHDGGTRVTRWLVLDIAAPAVFLPLKRAITATFDKENVRTMNALKQYAESQD